MALPMAGTPNPPATQMSGPVTLPLALRAGRAGPRRWRTAKVRNRGTCADGLVPVPRGAAGIGRGARGGWRGVALGAYAAVQKHEATAIGAYAQATAENAIALGGGQSAAEAALASGNRAIAVGRQSKATAADATAVGADALASGDRATALGYS